ncbi:MAG: metal ABC transporter permease, partial [Flammeovirgaceae bacterium]|nr:metal ABC transporter permease [Flammeovirgaceae bacterium]MDW8286608.1 iron chelate uptake ABC transporter family permease subunit [Flammeovirgaceae bacterium]
VMLATTLICTNAALIGTFAFLRKRSLAGDAVSHAILPGICLSFMLTQSKNAFVLLIGAFLSGWLALLTVDGIVRQTRLKPDAALSIVLSVFYGLGILLLTAIQHSGLASQAGLDKFLFGKAAAMVANDVYILGSIGLLILLIVILFYKPFKVFAFDEQYAEVKGFSVKKLHLWLSVLMVITIAIGIQAVGVVLMAALLITPAAAARYWTNRLPQMIVLAILFSVSAGVVGTFISYRFAKMPTGPWMVVILTSIAILSMLIGQKKGILKQWLKRENVRNKILTENILKTLYHLGEKDTQFLQKRTFSQILSTRPFEMDELKKGINLLERKNLINVVEDSVWLTPEGLEEGKRITRLHRLWELYLTEILRLPADRVHDDAEAIEHLITPELEAQLVHRLNYPQTDPHNEPIPYHKKS